MTTLTSLNHNPKWRLSNFRLLYAALYQGENSRAELLTSPRANALGVKGIKSGMSNQYNSEFRKIKNECL
jgi:hypothetical protein